MPVKAEFEYRCRRCGQIFVCMDQVLTDERDIAAVKHLRDMISEPGIGGPVLGIHFCDPPAGDPAVASKEVGVGDLIGYTVRSK